MIRFSTFGPHIDKSDMKFVKDAMQPKSWYVNPYKYCEKFEKIFAKYHDRKFALMTPNCTLAIHLFLLSLNLKRDDEVIVSESTWIATASPVLQTKAKLVLCDVDENTWCLSINQLRKIVTKKTKVIISTSVFGNMPNYRELEIFCKKRKIFLLEDAAESLGSTYNGKKSGKFGIASVFSFHRTKTITTGEGGMIIMDDPKIFKICKIFRDHGRDHGKTKDLFNDYFAVKYMPFNLQAALGYSQFLKLKKLLNIKRDIFLNYKKYLKNVKKISFNLDNKILRNGCWATVIKIEDLKEKFYKEIFIKLAAKGYLARPFFYPVSHLPAFKNYPDKSRIRKSNAKIAIKLNKTSIVLPSSFNLKVIDIKKICEVIEKVTYKNENSKKV
jgi:perosamine synthetase